MGFVVGRWRKGVRCLVGWKWVEMEMYMNIWMGWDGVLVMYV